MADDNRFRCPDCGEPYYHKHTCGRDGLSKKLMALAYSEIPDNERLQVLIHLVAEFVEGVEQ